jgi:hypothetical protein
VARTIDSGDRAAVSTIMGVYSYTSRTADLLRYTQVLSSTLQALLVKGNRYMPYHYNGTFDRLKKKWENARIIYDSPNGAAPASVILADIELILKVIAEREGLTASSAELFAGQLLEKPVPSKQRDRN